MSQEFANAFATSGLLPMVRYQACGGLFVTAALSMTWLNSGSSTSVSEIWGTFGTWVNTVICDLSLLDTSNRSLTSWNVTARDGPNQRLLQKNHFIHIKGFRRSQAKVILATRPRHPGYRYKISCTLAVNYEIP